MGRPGCNGYPHLHDFCFRLRHRMIEEKHRGHEQMHAEMILILFGAMLLAQIVLVVWKVRHKKSYHVSPIYKWSRINF